jgi:hypothetical protein
LPKYHLRFDADKWLSAFAVIEAANEEEALQRAQEIDPDELDWETTSEEPYDQLVGDPYLVDASDDWQHPEEEVVTAG